MKRSKRFAPAVACLLSCLLVQSPLFGMERELLMLMDIPIVVTASKTELPITEAPATIDVITQADIEKLGLRNLADALRLIPGFDVVDALYTSMFSPRGLNMKKLNSGVLCLLDGHPYYQTSESSTVNPHLVPLSNVKRIEVIKGPGSALYGANAFTGVINIITKTADDVNGTRVKVAAGDFDTQQQEVVAGYKLKDDIEFILTALRFRTLAYGGHKVSDNDDVENREIYAKVSGKKWALAFERMNADKGVPGTINKPQTDFRINELRNYASFDYGIDIGESVDVKLLSHVLQSKLSGNLISMVSSDASTALSAAGVTLADQTVEGLRKGAELQVNARVADQHSLVGGFEVIDEDNKSDFISGEKTLKSRGLYLQEEWRPLSQWIFTLGGRYDMPSTYDNVFSPRANITYKLSPETVFKTSYGEAYRAPSFIELYCNASMRTPSIPVVLPFFGPVLIPSRMDIVGNPNLKPERIKTAEVGVSHRWSKALSASVNLFQIWTNDLIAETQDLTLVPSTDPLQPLPTAVTTISYGNAGKAEVWGGEVSGRYAFSEKIGTQLSYSYQEAEDVDLHRQLAFAPRYKLGMRWDFQITDKFQCNTFTSYVGEHTEYWITSAFDRPPTSFTNVTFSYAATNALSLGLTVNNVFDNKYEEIGDVPLIGRNFLASASYHF